MNAKSSMPIVLTLALVGAVLAVSAPAHAGRHRFHEPHVGDLPLDRCLRSPRYDGCTWTGDGGYACSNDERLDYCGTEAQQEIADFFCREQGYELGASDFASRFVGPWPQDVARWEEPRNGGAPRFRKVLGWDVLHFVECRTRGEENLATFWRAKVGGLRIDRCVDHVDFGFFERCGEEAQGEVGDTFCRGFGYNWALDWQVTLDLGLHSIRRFIPGLAIGWHPNFGSEVLSDVTCEGDPLPLVRDGFPRDRFLRPSPIDPRFRLPR